MNKPSYTPTTLPLLTAILDKLPDMTKCKRSFFIEIFTLILSINGRLNYKNMARQGNYSQHTYCRNYKTLNFDHLLFNKILIQTEVQGKKAAYIGATFVSKSGKCTYGLGDFWDSCQGRAHKGLELSLISVVNFHANGKAHTAWPLSARQTPAKETLNGKTRNQWYGEHIQLCVPTLKELEIKLFGGDTAYTNKEIVDIVCQNELDFVGKLRKDANLMYLYIGEKTKKRGRPQIYAGKADFKDFSLWTKKEILFVNEEKTIMKKETLYDKIVWHKSLKRKPKVT